MTDYTPTLLGTSPDAFARLLDNAASAPLASPRVTRVTLPEYESEREAPRWYDAKAFYLFAMVLAALLYVWS